MKIHVWECVAARIAAKFPLNVLHPATMFNMCYFFPQDAILIQFLIFMHDFNIIDSLTIYLQFERHKKFVSDYILYYGGKMEDLRRST